MAAHEFIVKYQKLFWNTSLFNSFMEFNESFKNLVSLYQYYQRWISKQSKIYSTSFLLLNLLVSRIQWYLLFLDWIYAEDKVSYQTKLTLCLPIKIKYFTTEHSTNAWLGGAI